MTEVPTDRAYNVMKCVEYKYVIQYEKSEGTHIRTRILKKDI